MLRNRTLSAMRVWGADGMRSARALALVSGLYTWIQCMCSRIRQVDDGVNRGVAGCATGLLLGWQGGPWAAAQSCAGLGLISYIVDMGGSGETPPAHAATLATASTSSQPHAQHAAGSAQQQHQQQACCTTPLGLALQQPVQDLARSGPLRSLRAAAAASARARGRSAAQHLAALQALPPVMWLGALQPGLAYLA